MKSPHAITLGTFMRIRSTILGSIAALFSWGFWSQPQAYSAPAFEPMLGVLPLKGWSFLWGVVALVFFVAAIHRSIAIGLSGTVLALVLSSMWLIGLVYSHQFTDAPLSPTGFGLWAWMITSCILGLLVPRIEHPR